MRVVHQFAPPMSALVASLPGVTAADHVPPERRWDLPSDVEVVFVVHGEGETRDVTGVPRPAGWPGSVRLVQMASAGLDDYPEWLFEAPHIACASGTTARPIAEYALAVMLAHVKRLADVTFKPGDKWPSRDDMMANPSGTLEGRTLGLLGMCNWVCQWYRPGGRLGPHEIAGYFADLVLCGLSRPRACSDLGTMALVGSLTRRLQSGSPGLAWSTRHAAG